MDFAAVHHHAFDNDCYVYGDDELVISLTTGKDVRHAVIIWGDPFSWGILGGSEQWKGERLEINNVCELQNSLRWTAEVHPEFRRCRYYFELSGDDGTWLYCENGFYTPEQYRKMPFTSAFTFPWMNSADICCTPEWPERTVWYQIFPSRFARGCGQSVQKNVKAWAGPSCRVSNGDRFGGNLQGITDHLDYLADLGITGIYLNPVNLSHSQHKYDTTDYLEIDPTFGTKQEMKTLVAEAHRRNIRVMLDGVFNHSGWDFFAWQDVLKNREKSKYASWYMISDYSFEEKPGLNSRQGKYYAFAFADGMPKLNTNNQEVCDYITGVCEAWVKEYDVDALRLDVANEVSHYFCRQLRRKMRALKSDFYIVGEIWHNALPWLRGDEFDGVMNYPLQNAILNFEEVKDMTVRQFEWEMNRCLSMYYRQTERVLLNQMDSHDTARIATRSSDINVAMQQIALMFCMPGSACIYYGTEVLLEGGHDPDCRRCMPWKEIEAGDYDERIAFMKKLISLRKDTPALRSTGVKFIYDSEDPRGNTRVVHIRKTAEDGSPAADCVFNFDTDPVRVDCLGRTPLLAHRYASGIVQNGGFVIYVQ